MKAMLSRQSASSSLLVLLAVLVLNFFATDAALAKQSSKTHRALRTSAEPKAAKAEDDEDEQQGDDSDDDDEDDDDSDDSKDAKKQGPAVPKAANPHAAEEARLVKAVKDVEVELAANVAQQKQLKRRIRQLADESLSNREIDATAKQVANETDSKAMAGMMASMWKEMRMFETPSFTRHAEERIHKLKRGEEKLGEQLTAAQAKLRSARKTWASEGKEESDLEGEEPSKKPHTPAPPSPEEDVAGVVDGAAKVAANPEVGVQKTNEAAAWHRWSVWHMNSKQQKSVFLSTAVYLVFGVLLAYIYKQVREKGAFKPSPRRSQAAFDGQKDFSFGLFNCFGDPNVCVVGCCCPFLRWSDTVDRKGLLRYWPAFGIMFGLMLLHVYTMGLSTLAACALGVYYRQKLRQKYGIEAGGFRTVALDSLTWLCCQPCAIVQEAREEAATRDNA